MYFESWKADAGNLARLHFTESLLIYINPNLLLRILASYQASCAMHDQKFCLLSEAQFFIEEDEGKEHPLELLLFYSVPWTSEEINTFTIHIHLARYINHE